MGPWDVSQVPRAGPVGVPTGPNTELRKKISTGRDLGVTLRTFGRFVWRMAAGSALSDATDSATLTLPVDRQAIAEAATRFSIAHVRADGFLAPHRAVAIRWFDAPGIRAQIVAGAMHEMPTDAVSRHCRPCLRRSSIVPMDSVIRAPCSCHARASPPCSSACWSLAQAFWARCGAQQGLAGRYRAAR